MNKDKFIEYFGDSTDVEYLRLHYPRFCVTKELAYEQWKWDQADIRDGVQQLLNWKGNLAYDRKNLLPIFRKGIYSVVDLAHKSSGISIIPSG